MTDSLDTEILDALVLVNWIHGFESKDLKKSINSIVKNNLNTKGLIVYDIIENNKNYKFNHSVYDLIDEEQFHITILDGYPFGRKLVFAKKIETFYNQLP